MMIVWLGVIACSCSFALLLTAMTLVVWRDAEGDLTAICDALALAIWAVAAWGAVAYALLRLSGVV